MNFTNILQPPISHGINFLNIIITVILLFALTGTAFGQCSNNLLTNPGFENGLTGWNVLGSVEITFDAHSGTKAAKFCTGGYTGISQVFPASPGDVYTFKAFTKREGSGSSFAAVRLKYLSASWQPIGQEQSSPNYAWEEEIVVMEAPSGTAYVEASVIQETGTVCHFADDLCLTLGGASPCSITVTDTEVVCAIGDPNDPSDNTFEVTVTATNPAQTTGYQIDVPYTGQTTNGTYGLPLWIYGLPPSSGDITLTLTDNMVSGCSTDITVLPPPGCNENQNQLPDLSISGLALQNPSLQTGQNLNYGYDPSNIGTQQSGSFAIRAYISDDNSLSSNDLPVDLIPWSNLLAGSSLEGIDDNFIVPTSLAPGNYYLILKIDANESVTESNETNNVTSAPLTITGTGGGTGDIDLSLTLQQSSSTPSQWSNYTIAATVNNAGPQAATGVEVSFEKPNGVVYTGGNEWTSTQGNFAAFGSERWNVGTIPAGGSATLTVSYFLLESTAPIAYAQVVAANELDSDSAPNNGNPPTPNEDDEAATNSGNVIADLQILDVNLSTIAPEAGSPFSLQFEIRNNGTGNASGFEVRYLLSTNNQLDASDVSLGVTDWMTTLFAGSTSSSTDPSVAIPAGTNAGDYYILVDADHAGQVAESNEANNVLAKAISVTGGSDLADLQITGVNLTTSAPEAGSSFGLQFDIKNAGTANASGFEVRYLLSTDNQLDASDVSLDVTNWATTIFAGASTSSTDPSVTIPMGTASGNYYILVNADHTGQVAESNEANNVFEKAITVTGDNSGTPDCDAIAIIPGQGEITISGANAPHVLIKVFKPNWQLAFECLDNCSSPLLVDGLTEGNHHISIILMDDSWDQICTIQETVYLSNPSGGNGIPLRFNDGRQRMAFDKIYPNPAKYFVTFEIYSKDDQFAMLEFYNQQGQVMQRLEVQLERGRNEFKLDVSQWRSGTYNVIGRGNGHPSYSRFLKVWED